jgi:hypothetical protein
LPKRVRIIYPGLIAHKMCEMILELGMSHSKRAFADTLASNELLFNTLGEETP